jgi:hypothetical protein
LNREIFVDDLMNSQRAIAALGALLQETRIRYCAALLVRIVQRARGDMCASARR